MTAKVKTLQKGVKKAVNPRASSIRFAATLIMLTNSAHHQYSDRRDRPLKSKARRKTRVMDLAGPNT